MVLMMMSWAPTRHTALSRQAFRPSLELTGLRNSSLFGVVLLQEGSSVKQRDDKPDMHLSRPQSLNRSEVEEEEDEDLAKADQSEGALDTLSMSNKQN